MIKFEELCNILKELVATEFTDWSVTCDICDIVLHKNTNPIIFDNYFDNKLVILTRKDLFTFKIKNFDLAFTKSGRFNRFDDYNEQIHELYNLSYRLNSIIMPYKFSPEAILNRPKTVLRNLMIQCKMIEDELVSNIFKRKETELNFDIEAIDAFLEIDKYIEDILNSKNLKYGIIELPTTTDPQDKDIFVKGHTYEINSQSIYIGLSVDSTYKYTLVLSSTRFGDLFNIQKVPKEDIIKNLPACCGILLNTVFK